ncbi:hypothetical protein [Pelagibacterium luteolum]|uniref:Uncharacterized protein n=1 Tax=Pelagibacterium luteolum TaxID=440168 RepID=A0A1G7ZPG8_9HYPH|nr:hypothetical protein [Pelagibacterium luteolum]SDH10549.1 hypothetical protein SAMN04487974_12153 [Pelagibacterium luteolum]
MSSEISDRRRLAARIPRDVEHCERYLNRLAVVVERAGKNGHAFLPIVRRLEKELAEAKEDEQVLAGLKSRLAGRGS